MHCGVALFWLVGAALPACAAGPRYRDTFEASGPVFEGDDAWWTVVRDRLGADGEVYAVRCPRSELHAPSPACSWHRIERHEAEPATRELTGVRGEVIRAAAGCPAESITIASGDEVNGFVLYACGREVLYRRNAEGTWVESSSDASVPPSPF